MAEKRRQGPWHHRALVSVFSITFGLLIFWLLQFVMGDIGTWPGPVYKSVEEEVLDKARLQQQKSLSSQMTSIRADIAAKQERQRDLRDSTNSAETTMNRLLDIQRLALEKEKPVSEKERKSLDEAKDLFLSNQKQYQKINEEVAGLKERIREVNPKLQSVRMQLDEQQQEVQRVYERKFEAHEIKTAAIKLSVLVPLLVIGLLAWMRWRKTVYARLILAFGIATAAEVALVMHEHFPTRYFKYILISVAIAIIVGLLVRLLRHVAKPEADWLMRQFREAYERFVCPTCAYPIRRGPLRYRFWTRRSIAKMNLPPEAHGAAEDKPYVCPVCTTQLYDKCEKCGEVRPTLMRACPHCGAEHSTERILSAAGEREMNQT